MQPNQLPQPPQAQPDHSRVGFAVTSLVCGILALLALATSGGAALVFGAVAIATGILAIRAYNRGVGGSRPAATVGLVLGILAALCGLVNVTPNQTSSTASTASGVTQAAPTVKQAPAATAPAPTATTIPGEGMFLVGEEVQPGTYRSTGASPGIFELCVWNRLRDTSGDTNALLQFGSANANEPQIVTIRPSDGAFKTNGCESWTRIR